MKCEDFLPFVDAYVDGEFDELEHAEMDSHIATCEDCQSHVSFQKKWKLSFRESLGAESASDDLRSRIFDSLAEVAQDEVLETPAVEVEAAKAEPTNSRWRPAFVLLPLAAAALLAFAVVPTMTTVAPAKSDQSPMIHQTVDWHRGNYPIEVTGPDDLSVSNWFQNKVEFPVNLPEFQNQDVNLLGARLANMHDRKAALAVYEVDGTRLSVMLFDGKHLTVPSDQIRTISDRDIALVDTSGYRVAVLQNEGVTYTITSELPEKEFVKLLEGALKH